MSDVAIEILNMLEQGFRPATVASILNVPLDWVYVQAESMQYTTN